MMPAAMRVAMVIQAYRPVLGGAQRQVEQLAPLLAARGCDVHVVTRRAGDAPAGATAEAGATVHRLGFFEGRGAGAAYVTGAAAWLARHRPDVVHCHGLLSPTAAALLAAPVARAPLVVKIMSAGPTGDVGRLLTKPQGARRMALAARRVDAWVSLSDDVDADLLAQGVPAERIARIPNGVDCAHFAPGPGDRAAFGIPDDAVVAVYCGRFHPAKRVVELARAAQAAGVWLVLAGEGEEADALRALGDGLTIVDTVRDTAPLLRAADLYVSASVIEGMSGSVLEAMASGLPVVASPASGMRELLGDTPGIAADASEDALRAALARAAGDAAWRVAEGARLREVAASTFSLDVTASRLHDLYGRLRRR